jgi:hypothetical protein
MEFAMHQMQLVRRPTAASPGRPSAASQGEPASPGEHAPFVSPANKAASKTDAI